MFLLFLKSQHQEENGNLDISVADPGRNLTRAQQKARGRGYMDVENISELLTKRARWSDFYC